MSPPGGIPLPCTPGRPPLSFFERIIGQPLSRFLELPADQRSSTLRSAIPDLNFFFDESRSPAGRAAPRRTRTMAASLLEALRQETGEKGEAAQTLNDRVITDSFLRGEADRDQNVYLGRFFTRVLTRAVPDVIFQPVSLGEAARALRWGREAKVPVTLRGAASTAMGGAVPNEGGLTLDLSRLDHIELDVDDRVAVIGAGARLRTIHRRLAAEGLALTVYPSNLGGTLVGWFVTGGIGMNAFARGRALDAVRAADVVLPAGEHVRFHDDGRLDVPDQDHRRKTLPAEERDAWFAAHGYQSMTLADLAGSEGTLGMVLKLAVAVEPRREIGAFLLGFARREQALEAAAWVVQETGGAFTTPANVKLLSGSHLHHMRRVWDDEDSRAWRREPARLGTDADLPWTRIVGPRDLGLAGSAGLEEEDEDAGAYLFVDFLGLDGARAFAAALSRCPGEPRVHAGESERFARERFRPMQTKRLGPGLLAAEIVLPASELPRFLPAADRLATGMGSDLDAEVYYLGDGSALAIGAYLVDHRRGSFAVELMLAPALVDLAMSRFQGRPYVLGRWQSPWMTRKFGGAGAARMRSLKRALDPGTVLSRGVLYGFRLRGLLGGLTAASFQPGVRFVRMAGSSPLAGLLRAVRRGISGFPGPAHGRGEPALVGAPFRVSAPGEPPRATPQAAAARALHCVNCGECNSVCPIFQVSKIRLPQMLTHIGEAVFAGEAVGGTGIKLLDLCMRCGNCEEVCQAGIPHLPLYQVMQGVSERAEMGAPTQESRRERHLAILGVVRSSPAYSREFLDVRPGQYLRRTPASLPGVNRFLLLRAENDDGPAATCIHCGACVPVCPTGANKEYEGADLRWITTDQNRCIGCGTCVEVCPANQANRGQTLRVMEAPTRDWFVALEELERAGTP